MPNVKSRKSDLFDRPCNYRIQVIGSLHESWSEKRGGLRISFCSSKDQEEPVTELIGKVRGQAELLGLLDSLYELHLTLLSVEYLNGE
jgi:hypothetical protein